MDSQDLMRRAIALSHEGLRTDRGGPFGAVVAKNGQIIGEGFNQVVSTNDPTAHAEMVAIRNACQSLGDFKLRGCEIYTSCEPCPMCLSAIYWARIDRIYYANSRVDASAIGFDDEFIYRELGRHFGDRTLPMQRLLADEARSAFQEWSDKADRVMY